MRGTLNRGRRHRSPRLASLSINRLLPNVLTMLALCGGVTAIRFGVQQRWEAAALAILIAAVLDALDGRIARLLNGQSKFGAELDSLSDVVSFGVAPAIVLYLWVLDAAGTFGWIAVLAFCVCAALRLARFNSKLGDSDLPSWAYNYFTGVPGPAGAALALLPMMASFETGPGVASHPVLVGLWTVAVALLMISQIPTFSMKGLRVPHRYLLSVLAGVGLLAACLVGAPWPTLCAVALAYLVSIPFSIRQFRRLRVQAARVQATAIAAVVNLPSSPSSP
ncbi:MAG: CDP-diacylglycerol--serine O-phosphatidyltransferase [Azospirillaceae bacterium]|nr:CDP-diacylglycerol--serine O-phosphatidyltransferase [Azospirillaceae bacterium]